MEKRMTRSMGLLAILIACGVAGAEAPLTANLTVTPSPTVRRGETDVRYPAPNHQAGLGFVTGFAVPADAKGGKPSVARLRPRS